jgi:hypothetical protein
MSDRRCIDHGGELPRGRFLGATSAHVLRVCVGGCAWLYLGLYLCLAVFGGMDLIVPALLSPPGRGRVPASPGPARIRYHQGWWAPVRRTPRSASRLRARVLGIGLAARVAPSSDLPSGPGAGAFFGVADCVGRERHDEPLLLVMSTALSQQHPHTAPAAPGLETG